MAAVAPMRVEVGQPDPLHGGLLNIGKSLGFLHDVSDPHIGMGAAWEAAVCGNPDFAPGVCDDALGIDPDTDKVFDPIPSNNSQPFGIYKGIACDLFRTDYETVTRAALEIGESFAVEQAVDTLILNDSPTLLNSGDPTSIVDALGFLETAIAEAGAGQGLIHVSRFGAAWLANTRGVKTDPDFHLWTAQGTPIVNGGGYGRGVSVAGSQFWVYATGPFHLFRNTIEYTEAPGLGVNTKFAIAERLYTAGRDCFTVAVLVDPSVDTVEVGP